jgi:hypothetical protein
MSTLKSRLDSLASTFATEVVRAIQGASLEELLGEIGGAKGTSARQNGVIATTARPKAKSSGRLSRRSAEDIASTLAKIVALVKRHKEGLRAEQIRAELGMEAKEMPRVLKEGLAKKALKSKGHKRATTYFVA